MGNPTDEGTRRARREGTAKRKAADKYSRDMKSFDRAKAAGKNPKRPKRPASLKGMRRADIESNAKQFRSNKRRAKKATGKKGAAKKATGGKKGAAKKTTGGKKGAAKKATGGKKGAAKKATGGKKGAAKKATGGKGPKAQTRGKRGKGKGSKKRAA